MCERVWSSGVQESRESAQQLGEHAWSARRRQPRIMNALSYNRPHEKMDGMGFTLAAGAVGSKCPWQAWQRGAESARRCRSNEVTLKGCMDLHGQTVQRFWRSALLVAGTVQVS